VKTIFRKHLNALDWLGNYPKTHREFVINNKPWLQKLHCTTMTKLIEAIIQVWYRDSKSKTAKNW